MKLSSRDDVRYWPLADIPGCAAHVRFRGKADITWTLQTLYELRHIGWVIFSLSLHR
jgi:hypothetical protein